jgi:hypothetical protein
VVGSAAAVVGSAAAAGAFVGTLAAGALVGCAAPPPLPHAATRIIATSSSTRDLRRAMKTSLYVNIDSALMKGWY